MSRAGGILQASYVMTPVIDALLISTAKSFQSFETYVVEGNVCFVFYVNLPMNNINRKHQMCAELLNLQPNIKIELRFL